MRGSARPGDRPAAETWIIAYAAHTALAASWRMMASVALVTIPPLGLAAVMLAAVGIPPLAVRHGILAAACFPASFFTHEFGHALAAAAIARWRGADGTMFGAGTFFTASVVRWRSDACGDAIIALAGPLFGTALVWVALLPGPGYLLAFPVALLYLVHLGSLLPSQADGRSVRAYMTSTKGLA